MQVLNLLREATEETNPIEELASEFVMSGWVVLKDIPLAVYSPDRDAYAIIEVHDNAVTVGDTTLPLNVEDESFIMKVVELAEKYAQSLPKKEPAKTTALLSLIMTGTPSDTGDSFTYEDFVVRFTGEKAVARNAAFGYTVEAPYPAQGGKIERAMFLAYDLFAKIERARKLEPLYAELERRRLEYIKKKLRELARERGLKVEAIDEDTLDIAGNIINLPRVIKSMEGVDEEDRAILARVIREDRSKSDALKLLRQHWDKVAEEIFATIK